MDGGGPAKKSLFLLGPFALEMFKGDGRGPLRVVSAQKRRYGGGEKEGRERLVMTTSFRP